MPRVPLSAIFLERTLKAALVVIARMAIPSKKIPKVSEALR
jgi:hypothetical protein